MIDMLKFWSMVEILDILNFTLILIFQICMILRKAFYSLVSGGVVMTLVLLVFATLSVKSLTIPPI